jgi:hypothetical protein
MRNPLVVVTVLLCGSAVAYAQSTFASSDSSGGPTPRSITYSGAGGSFAFGESATTGTGNSLASLLLGWVQQGMRSETLPNRARSLTMSGFVQDDWKVSSWLTIEPGPTLGLGLERRFNTSAYAAPLQFTFGNAGRTAE